MQIVQNFYNRAEFGRDVPVDNAGQVIGWWESRRIFFNCAVGATGLLSCLLMIVCAFVSEPITGDAIGLPDGPLLGVFGILAYGIAANLCYTLGWIVELGLFAESAERANRSGPQLFRIGMTFSILLTLLPALLCWIIFAHAAITGYHAIPQE